MASLQLADCSKPVILLKPSLSSLFAHNPRHLRSSQPPSRFVPSASSSSSSSVCRRRFISDTAAVSLSVAAAPFLGAAQPARSEDSLSEWERVYLPTDPGVVLLDIAFVPDDLNHGQFAQILVVLFPFAVWLLRKSRTCVVVSHFKSG